MRGMLKILSMVSLAVIATGCITSGKCRVGVANATDTLIRSVVLVDTKGNSYTFMNLKPHPLVVDYKPIRGVFGKGLVVRIARDRGTNNVSRIVDLESAVDSKSRGTLLFQIEDDDQVRPFFQPQDAASAGSLPWAQQPSWQGTMPLPGMPQQN